MIAAMRFELLKRFDPALFAHYSTRPRKNKTAQDDLISITGMSDLSRCKFFFPDRPDTCNCQRTTFFT
jgi:hypothetical protein